MMPTQAIELIQRVIALSQHEAAHWWIITVALGFEAQEIKLEIQSLEAHRGKVNTPCRRSELMGQRRSHQLSCHYHPSTMTVSLHPSVINARVALQRLCIPTGGKYPNISR